MRKLLPLLVLTSLLALTACSEVKLSNNKVREDHAGQDGYDVTHQVTERHEQHQSGATGVAVAEVNTGTKPNPGKPDANAGAVTAVENTATQEITGAKDTSRNGVPQQNH
ncbi:MAG: hypothetical protein NVS9B15_24830 [Acidobacteriaceae bacterium]